MAMQIIDIDIHAFRIYLFFIPESLKIMRNPDALF